MIQELAKHDFLLRIWQVPSRKVEEMLAGAVMALWKPCFSVDFLFQVVVADLIVGDFRIPESRVTYTTWKFCRVYCRRFFKLSRI